MGILTNYKQFSRHAPSAHHPPRLGRVHEALMVHALVHVCALHQEGPRAQTVTKSHRRIFSYPSPSQGEYAAANTLSIDYSMDLYPRNFASSICNNNKCWTLPGIIDWGSWIGKWWTGIHAHPSNQQGRYPVPQAQGWNELPSRAKNTVEGK